MIIDHAGRWLAGKPVDHDGRLAVKLSHDMEVDTTSLGTSYQVIVVNRMNPNM
jgi:hypothetical protein